MARVTTMERRGSVFYYRRRVPADLKGVIGRVVIKETLKERDPVAARYAHSRRAALWEERFAAARQRLAVQDGPVRSELTDDEIRVVGERYRGVLLSEDERIRLRGLSGEEDGLADDQFERHGFMLEQVERFSREDLSRGRVVGPGRDHIVEDALQTCGIKLSPDSESYRRVAAEILTATIEAMQAARRRQNGDPVRTPPTPQATQIQAIPDLSVETLIDGWARENEPRKKTIYVFRKHLQAFAAFAGLNVGQIDVDHAASWKLSLLEQKTPKSTYNYLASCKAVFGWAKSNRLIRSNPFSDVKLPKIKKKSEVRDFTEEETLLILKAARLRAGWKRWVPWLLAFTGARITEICQLERTDIGQSNGIWFIDITDIPEEEKFNGTKELKNEASKRRVPIHKALLDEGFLDFVKTKRGLVFPEITPDCFGSLGGNPSKSNGRWIRDKLLIKDHRVSPAHSFRHRFKTLCRNALIAIEVHDALTGHITPEYGKRVNLEVRSKAMALIPIPEGLFPEAI